MPGPPACHAWYASQPVKVRESWGGHNYDSQTGKPSVVCNDSVRPLSLSIGCTLWFTCGKGTWTTPHIRCRNTQTHTQRPSSKLTSWVLRSSILSESLSLSFWRSLSQAYSLLLNLPKQCIARASSLTQLRLGEEVICLLLGGARLAVCVFTENLKMDRLWVGSCLRFW